ncbi:MAG: hypothetical protein K2P37_02665 [Oscillospiraceae bacterium]|nr:hypothetical protein [Oscillospiraceae bacterium]
MDIIAGLQSKNNAEAYQLLLMLEEGSAARQRLAALRSVILYKPQLGRRITDKLDKLDLSKYKDSMRPLIERDMEELRTLIERKGV